MNEEVILKFEKNLPKIKEYIKTHQLKNEKFIIEIDAKILRMSKKTLSWWG